MPFVTENRLPTDTKADLRQTVIRHAIYSRGMTIESLSPRERFHAVALAIRDRMVEKLLATEQRYQQASAKRLYYLSMEFLIGRSLGNNLVNLRLLDTCRQILEEL